MQCSIYIQTLYIDKIIGSHRNEKWWAWKLIYICMLEWIETKQIHTHICMYVCMYAYIYLYSITLPWFSRWEVLQHPRFGRRRPAGRIYGYGYWWPALIALFVSMLLDRLKHLLQKSHFIFLSIFSFGLVRVRVSCCSDVNEKSDREGVFFLKIKSNLTSLYGIQ